MCVLTLLGAAVLSTLSSSGIDQMASVWLVLMLHCRRAALSGTPARRNTFSQSIFSQKEHHARPHCHHTQQSRKSFSALSAVPSTMSKRGVDSMASVCLALW